MGPALLLAHETEIAYRREQVLDTFTRIGPSRRRPYAAGEGRLARVLRRRPLTAAPALGRHA